MKTPLFSSVFPGAAAWLACAMGLTLVSPAMAQGFQASDLAILGEPFRVTLPQGDYDVAWGDGVTSTVSNGLGLHRYRKPGVAMISVKPQGSPKAGALTWDYAAMVKASDPRFFLEKSGGKFAKGPAASIPAIRLEKQPLTIPETKIQADSFSIEAWVRVDALTGEQVIAQSGNAETGGFRFLLAGGDLTLALTGSGKVSAPVADRVAAGAWHHVAVLYDRVPLFPRSNRLWFFVDGQLAGEGSIDAADAGAISASGLQLGGGDFQGELAAVAVYDKLLFPVAIWDRVRFLAEPNQWPVTVAPPGASGVRVAEPQITKTVPVPLDSDPQADNGPALRDAVKAAEPGTRLRLVDKVTGQGGGRFFIRSGLGEPHWASILVEGKTDFELDGNGSTIIFSDSVARYVLVKDGKRVAIRNLSFDLDPSYARVGMCAKLLEINRETGWVKAQLINGRDGSPDPVIPRRASYWRWRPHRPDNFRINDKAEEFRADRYAEAPKPDGSGRPGVIAFRMKTPASDKFWDKLQEYADGDNLYIINNGDFRSNAVSLMESEDTTFERVNFYATLGMVFLSSDIKRTRVASCVIGIPPGMTVQDRPLAAGADGYHFHETQGDIIFENNEVALTDDDPISMKDGLWSGIKRVTDYQLDVRKKGISKGDPVEILGGEYLPTGFRAAVTKVEGTIVTLDRRLPQQLEEGAVLVNRLHCTRNWILRGNYFHDYYGRVMLYTDFGTVIGNRVHDSLYHLGLSTAYFEVAGISASVVTHRNLFVNTNADTSNWGGNSKKVVFQNITFSANSFLGKGLDLAQVGNGLIVRNGFYRSKPGNDRGMISITGSRGVQVIGNLQFIPGNPAFTLANRNNQNLVELGNRAFPGPTPTPPATPAPTPAF